MSQFEHHKFGADIARDEERRDTLSEDCERYEKKRSLNPWRKRRILAQMKTQIDALNWQIISDKEKMAYEEDPTRRQMYEAEKAQIAQEKEYEARLKSPEKVLKTNTPAASQPQLHKEPESQPINDVSAKLQADLADWVNKAKQRQFKPKKSSEKERGRDREHERE